jgi:hypothetical protein
VSILNIHSIIISLAIVKFFLTKIFLRIKLIILACSRVRSADAKSCEIFLIVQLSWCELRLADFD